MKLILKIIISGLAVMLAAKIVPGIYVSGFGTALLVALVFGVLNSTLGFFLKVLTFPLTVITFGFFLLVINALMFQAASFVKGFEVTGFWPAFFGSLIVTFVSLISKKIIDN